MFALVAPTEHGGISSAQARTVARSKTIRVSNQGRMTAYRQAQDGYGIEMDKQWIAALDARTRDIHADMHMDKAPLERPFGFRA